MVYPATQPTLIRNRNRRNRETNMSSHRTWDESQSPQWRYLLEKESVYRKNKRKTSSRLRRQELEQSVSKIVSEQTNNKKERFKDINSELKNENSKRITRLSTNSKEQE